MAIMKKLLCSLGEYYLGTQMIRDRKYNTSFLREFMIYDTDGEIKEEKYMLMNSLLASKVMPMAWQLGGIYGLLTDKDFITSVGLIVAGELCRAGLHIYRQKSIRPFVRECKRKMVDSMKGLEERI